MKNNKLRTFLLFFLISSVLWLSSQMTKKYLYTFKVPVIYSNLPTQFYKGFLPNDTLKIKLEMTGYQILKNKIIPKKLELDIKKHHLIDQQSWKPPKFKELINELFSYQANVISISPNKVNFRIKAVQKKYLPILADIQLKYAPGYKNKTKPILKPDSIWAYGNQEILDTIHFVKTKHYTLNNINKSIYKLLNIKKITGVKFNKDKTLLKIPVSEIVEENLSLPIEINGLPDNLTILLFPKNVKLNYKFFKDDFKEFTPNDFKVIVDYDAKKKQYSPKLAKKPAGIFDYNFEPNKITYLIKQK